MNTRLLVWLATIKNPYNETDNNLDYKLWYKCALFLSEFFSLILSYSVVIIIIGLAIMTALDVLYMSIPTYQSLLSRKGLDGSREDSKVKLISKSAIDAVQEASCTGKGMMTCYMKHRLKTYIISAIVMMILGLGSPFVIELLDALTKTIREAFKV